MPEHGRVELDPLVIDVEKAPWYEWALIEGIGEVRARRIADWVRDNGPLESLDELARVPGIPEGWLETARPFLRLERSRPGEEDEREP